MLEAFRILEEDKGIKKEDIIDAVVESLRSAYRRRYGQSDSVAIDFNEKNRWLYSLYCSWSGWWSIW